MNPTAEEQEQEEQRERKPRVALEVITGGRGPSGPDEDWFINMKPGTHFLFKDKNSQATGVMRAMLLHKYALCSLLVNNLNSEEYFIVETLPFQTRTRLIEVIGIQQLPVSGRAEEPSEEPKQEEQDNGAEHNRAD